MIALVTGGGGFLGRYIVERLLARSDRVVAFGRTKTPELESTGVRFVQGDLRSRDDVTRACQGVDCVFHTAAIAGIWGRWSDFHAINVVGTENVIAACQKQGVKRLVYTSSPSVTFSGDDQEGIDESAPYPRRWLCHYSHSKALAELAVLAAHNKNLATCALRPHLVWGPRDRHLIPRLIERARGGQLRRVGDGKNLVDMIYVENAAEAHLLAAEKLALPACPPGGKAYFLSQGEPVNCWNWINEILSLAGLPPVSKSISYRAAWWAGGVMEVLGRLTGRQHEPRMTRFLAGQLAKSHYFSIRRAQNDFAYRPRISTEEGMQRLGEWLKSEAANRPA